MNPLVEALIIGGIKYGPEFVSGVVKLLKTETVTVEDVDKLFQEVKPYSAFNINEDKAR